MAELTQTPQIVPPPPALQVPLWRVRMRLIARGVRTNISLFSENPIGLVGLGIIAFYLSLIIIHPILMKTVWDPVTYNPVVG